MSEPADGTLGQPPDHVPDVPLPRPSFVEGDTVPGLSSWVLERRLGGGGFGEVWLARHSWNAREKLRAVKFCTDPAARHRLVTHERNVVVRVMRYAGDHPNIVPLLDCNLDGDLPWLMYEFVEGGTLAGLIERWRVLPLPNRLGRAVMALHALAGALAACHRLDPPLVHRDLKPHNVLIAEGRVPRITDFGLGSVVVRPAVAAGALTASTAQLPTHLRGAGTPVYAPPEQRLGSPPDPRDDVYALGIIAYQMVTGDLLAAPGPDAALELDDMKVPGELAALVVQSVAMNPERRPKDATEWEAVLAGLIASAPLDGEADDAPDARSRPVILPEPMLTDRPQPTELLPVRPVASAQPHPAPRPAPRPVETRAPRPARSRKPLVALACGGLVLVALAAAVAALLPPRPRVELTWPVAKNEAKGGPKEGPKRDTPAPKDSHPDAVAVAPPPREMVSVAIAPQPREKVPDPEPTPVAPAPRPVVAAVIAVAPEPRAVELPPKPGEARDIEIAPGVKMTFCWVPAGEAQLGSPKAEQDAITNSLYAGKRPAWLDDESEAKRAKFKTAGFWMGKYEVTQAQWAAVMGSNPSYFDGKQENKAKGMDTARFPVDHVSWDMVCGKGRFAGQGFLDRVNAHGGVPKALGRPGRLKLPHEDQWEYACRGGQGNGRPFYFGNRLNGRQANCNGNYPYGTAVKGPYLERTRAADDAGGGDYPAHPWGLAHMHGNVYEWCDNVRDGTDEPVLRGGSWLHVAATSRSAFRFQLAPGSAHGYTGFRLVVAPP